MARIEARQHKIDKRLQAMAASLQVVSETVGSVREADALLSALTSFAAMKPWSKDVGFVERILRIAALGHEWNGPGTEPFDGSTVVQAILLATEITRVDRREPFVAPGNDGSIVLEWDAASGSELSLHLMPSEDGLTAVLINDDLDVEVASPAALRLLLVDGGQAQT